MEQTPHELHLRILEGVDDFSDCAAFSLASPRLGLLALRSGLARFEDPLFAVAMRLLLIQRFAGGFGVVTLSEDTLRRCADRRASADHFPWLARVSPALRLEETKEARCCGRASLLSGQVKHFEGERGAERKVRKVFASGTVHCYEGGQDAERKVRAVRADGAVAYFEGQQGAERHVRTVFSDGNVHYFEGERGAERKVRTVRVDGQAQYYEGESGAERLVRVVCADGEVWFYEGERGAERVLRNESSNGQLQHYEGE